MSQPEAPEPPEPPLPDDLVAALTAHGLPTAGETALRRALEARLPGYTVHRLMPAAARRWKTRYRLMDAAAYYDGASMAEVYARALLAVLARQPPTPRGGEEAGG